MAGDRLRITRELLVARTPDGAVLSVVEYDDGRRFGLARDGRPIPDTTRDTAELDACVAEFARLTGTTPRPAPEPPADR